jgi:hypothetical protein
LDRKSTGCKNAHCCDELFAACNYLDQPVSADHEATANAQRTLSENLAFFPVVLFIAARRVFHFRTVLQPFVLI